MRQRIRPSSLRTWLWLSSFLLIFGVLTSADANASTPVPGAMQVTVGAPSRTGPWTVYPLSVGAAGTPVLAIFPRTVRQAELVVNGTIVLRAGLDANVGALPFGQGTSALQLTGLTPRDRVEIRALGVSQAPVIDSNLRPIGRAFGSGLGSGLFFGILFAILLFQIAAAVVLKDPMLFWYIGFLCSIVGIESAEDGFLGVGQGASENLLLGFDVSAQIFYGGFTIVYLRLRQDAPRLMWIFIALNVALCTLPSVVQAITRAPAPIATIVIMSLLLVGVSVTISLLRWRDGFKPAAFFALAPLGIATALGSRLVRHWLGIDAPFADRWSFQTGLAFDFIIFSLGIAYRARFTYREQRVIEEELREATVAAGHDPLTGLLNRRGLDAWIAATGSLTGTVLFIDLDDFKTVNDEGGHAAGDDALTVVARIIRHSVRAQDAVARFGGDEFVVVLAESNDPATVEDILARISSAVGFLLPLGSESDTRLGVSIGTAALDRKTPFAEALKRADSNAYRVKAEHHAKARKLRRSRIVALPGS